MHEQNIGRNKLYQHNDTLISYNVEQMKRYYYGLCNLYIVLECQEWPRPCFCVSLSIVLHAVYIAIYILF